MSRVALESELKKAKEPEVRHHCLAAKMLNCLCDRVYLDRLVRPMGFCKKNGIFR